jgi:cell division protein FtsQ
MVLVAAVWVVGFTGVLGVRTVAVSGTRVLAAEQVREVAAVRTGEPLARVDIGAVRDRVAGLAGVARVAVSRSWPSTLRITVTERQGVAVVGRNGGSWLVDPAGYVFQRVATRPRTLPRLDVAAAGPDDPATDAALRALAALPPEVARQVLAIAAPRPESVTLTLTRRRVVVWGGTAEAGEKARVLAALLRRPGTRFDVSTPAVVTAR